jgi:ankyrin repeat protein
LPQRSSGFGHALLLSLGGSIGGARWRSDPSDGENARVSAILEALYRGDGDAAREAAAGAELDVLEAAALGDADRVRELVSADRELVALRSPDGFTALHYAAFFGTADAARVLLEHGADPGAVAQNEMRVEPLHSAAAVDANETARLLLDAGADPNAEQQGGFRPIDAAVQNGNDELYALLLERGAEPPAPSE